MATITDPVPENQLVPVAFDDRTAGGLPLPHPNNSAKRDAVRIRAALILLDAMLSGNQAAIEAAVSEAIDALVGAAPELLNTLDEISSALGDDPNFAATMTAALGQKANATEVASALAPLAARNSPQFTGNPTAPTAAEGDSDTTIATTAFVQREAALLAYETARFYGI